MILTRANLTTPSGFFWLFVEVVLAGLVVAVALWIINTYITPNLPAPFQWIANVLIGLFLLALLFFFFLNLI